MDDGRQVAVVEAATDQAPVDFVFGNGLPKAFEVFTLGNGMVVQLVPRQGVGISDGLPYGLADEFLGGSDLAGGQHLFGFLAIGADVSLSLRVMAGGTRKSEGFRA